MLGIRGAGHRLAMLAASVAFVVPWLGVAPARGTVTCGDGNVDEFEVCDDGNTVPDDACSFPSCLPRVCGDDIVNPDPGTDEECDDSNTVDDDGCTHPACEDDCGDGEIDAGLGETCDDGNETNGDDCDDDVSTSPPGNCTITACGNGVITGFELCDDGNTVDGDGCPATCTTREQVRKGEQDCINAINKRLEGVVRAQNADDAACVRSVAAGKTPAIGDCLGEDVDQKVSRAQQKTNHTGTSKCGLPNTPSLLYTAPATVNLAGSAEPLESVSIVFGEPPSIILSSADRDGAKCQAQVLKQHNAVMNKWISEAVKAKRRALKGGEGVPPDPPPAVSTAEVAAGIDAEMAATTRLARTESRAIRGITNGCTDTQAADLFDCGGATTATQLAACAIEAAKEGACNALEVADGLALDCPSVPVIP